MLNLLAADIETDVETVVTALNNFGQSHNIASAQASRADRYRRSTMEDTAFLEGDALDDDPGC